MAGHSDSSSSEKKSSEARNDIPTFSAENLQNNMKVIYYRFVFTFSEILNSVLMPISKHCFNLQPNIYVYHWRDYCRNFRVHRLYGVYLLFLVMAIASIGLIAKANFSVHSYFDSWNRIILDGFMGGLMSFVLFWTYPFFKLRNFIAVIHGHTTALGVEPSC
ncbi:hypothetical protein CRYUN_Cryun18bG0003900 [Craigia yunnanensis]